MLCVTDISLITPSSGAESDLRAQHTKHKHLLLYIELNGLCETNLLFPYFGLKGT